MYFIQRLEICFFVRFIGCSSASNKYWSSMSSMACKSRLAASLSFLISKSPPFRVLLSVFFLSAAISFSLCSLPYRFSGQSLQSSSNTNTAAQIRFWLLLAAVAKTIANMLVKQLHRLPAPRNHSPECILSVRPVPNPQRFRHVLRRGFAPRNARRGFG